MLDRSICGEPDSEMRRNMMGAMADLMERYIGCVGVWSSEDTGEAIPLEYVVQPMHVEVTIKTLLRATNDYSVDKRGDTGSWSRIIASKGLVRVLSAAFRSEQCQFPQYVQDVTGTLSHSLLFTRLQSPTRTPDAEHASGVSGAISIGAHVQTSDGIGVVDNVVRLSNETFVYHIRYPLHSVAHQSSVDDSEGTEGCHNVVTVLGNAESVVFHAASSAVDPTHEECLTYITAPVSLPRSDASPSRTLANHPLVTEDQVVRSMSSLLIQLGGEVCVVVPVRVVIVYVAL